MKTIYKFLSVLFLLSQACFATDFTYPTKTKRIHKEFSADGNSVMQVNNKYGNVTVVLWDQNKINYLVDITVCSNSEKKTMELLENISVDFSQNNNTTLATTTFPKKGLSGNNEIEINYTIKIPKNASANIQQKYGNIYINELHNKLDLTCNYGKIKIGKLNSKHNHFTLSYLNSSEIDFLNYGTFDIKYSKIDINTVNYLVSNGNYNTFKIANAGTFNFKTNYSKIECGKVQKSEISGNYLTINLNEIGISSIIESNYTTSKLTASSGIEFIQSLGNYSTTTINQLANIPFTFNFSGNYFNHKSDLNLDYTLRSTESNKSEFVGSYKNNSKLKINVKSNYGSVILK